VGVACRVVALRRSSAMRRSPLQVWMYASIGAGQVRRRSAAARPHSATQATRKSCASSSRRRARR
jgi:hypothetical protein